MTQPAKSNLCSEIMPIKQSPADKPVLRTNSDVGDWRDPLTGLLALSAFESTVTRQISSGMRPHCQSAIIRLDLDRFIRVNDRFGFATGNTLLSKLARRLEQTVAQRDGFVGRYGQDEFVIFVNDVVNLEELVGITRSLLGAVSTPFICNGRQFFLTASIGAALFPQDGDNIVALIERAGREQESVRIRGRNGFQIARPESLEHRAPVARLESALRKSIELDEMFLLYQPILNMHSRQLVGVEALLRWRHPELGILTPDQFLPLASETGLIVDLGEWVLSNACSQVSQWDQLGFDGLQLCVNFSSQQLQVHNVAHRIDSILSHTNLNHDRLSVELAAGGGMTAATGMMRSLQEIKESGIKLALDNFGVGDISINNLNDLPFDSLKIDRTVVRKINTSASGENLVNGLTLLGKAFGLRVTAEGVETQQQFELLDRGGCNSAQGYLLSRPIDPNAIASLLQQSDFEIADSKLYRNTSVETI
jgi:diguanylate cyclase (GGDEF)-like protein